MNTYKSERNGRENGLFIKEIMERNGYNGVTISYFEKNNEVDNRFLKNVVKLILEEKRIVGSAALMKNDSQTVVDFKQPKELENILDLKIPNEGLSDDELLELCRKTIQYSVKTNHPHFYNQLYAGIDEYALAATWLTEALNTSQATYEISPVFTLMERKIIKYLGSFCKWNNEDIDGIFSPGGSLANIYGMVLGRHKMFPNSKKSGIRNIGDLVLFVSEDAHYSYVKGAIWLGMGSDAVIKVKTDAKGRMNPLELDKAIIKAKREGKVPFFVGCTAGTTVLGAFDPLLPIAEICRSHNLWMHVDAALGGTVLLSRKYRGILDGIQFADSMTWNLHKLAAIPLQSSAFLTRHNTLLTECNSLNAEYLFQCDKYYDSSYDSGDKSIQCGRKVESLKVWLAFVARGERKMEELVDNIFDMVEYTCKKLREKSCFKLVLPEFQSNNVCFWFVPQSMRRMNSIALLGNESKMKLSKVCPLIKGKMMEKGNLMVNYQPLTSKNLPNFFRLVFTCIPATTKADIDFIVNEIEKLGNVISIE